MANTIEAAAKAATDTQGEHGSNADRDEILLDRRTQAERRLGGDAKASEAPSGGEKRRKAPRRRQIDPTTCERDYSDAEIEFMQAMDDYKRANGRMFPTCSEILEVIQLLGYQKVAPSDETADSATADDSVTDPLDEGSDDALTDLELEQPPADEEI